MRLGGVGFLFGALYATSNLLLLLPAVAVAKVAVVAGVVGEVAVMRSCGSTGAAAVAGSCCCTTTYYMTTNMTST